MPEIEPHSTAQRSFEERLLELERRVEISDSLQAIIEMINSDLPLEAFLDHAVELAARRLGAAGCVLHRFDLDNNQIINTANYGLEGIYKKGRKQVISALGPVGAESYLQATLQRKPTCTNYPPLPERVDEILSSPSIPDEIKPERVELRKKFAASFSVPLIIQDHVYGGMVFYYRDNQNFSQQQIDLGMAFARQVSVALENAYLHQQNVERQRELQILLDITSTANSSLELDEALEKTLELLTELVDASRCGIALVDPDSGKLKLRMLKPEQVHLGGDLDEMLAAGENAALNRTPLFIETDPDQGFLEPGALIPLFARDRLLGVLGIIGPLGGSFSPRQKDLFRSIAEQISMAIENATLYQQAEQSAIAAERNRLARDLHDAVSQTLFSASLIADVLPKLWRRSPETAEEKLEELRMLTRGALSEMRTLLFELRPASLTEMDLSELLRHLTNAFSARTRIGVELNTSTELDPPAEIKEVFYRVAQEALNNISKHARAATVSVELECSEAECQMRINDDGNGFDLGEVSAQSLGLQIMSERAEGIGAKLNIETEIGRGTHITLQWKEQ